MAHSPDDNEQMSAALNLGHKLIVTGLVAFSAYGFVKISGGTVAVVQDVKRRKAERLAEVAAEGGSAELAKDERGKTKLGDG